MQTMQLFIPLFCCCCSNSLSEQMTPAANLAAAFWQLTVLWCWHWLRAISLPVHFTPLITISVTLLLSQYQVSLDIKRRKKKTQKSKRTHWSELIIHTWSCRGQRVVSFCSEKHMFGCQMRTYCVRTKMKEILRTRFRGKVLTSQHLYCYRLLSIRLSSKKVMLLLTEWWK